MDLEAQRTRGRLQLRYEDVAQDGRVQLETLPVALGVVWRALSSVDAVQKELLARGILPILTRFELEGTSGPFAVESEVEVDGGYALAHAVDDAGNVARIFLDMDCALWGDVGRTNLAAPADAGARALVGRVRAEHVFTRPFGPPEARKVLALPVALGFDARAAEHAGPGAVPRARRAWRTPVSTLAPPAGARPLEDGFAEDVAPVVVGLSHTDSNQHVNSLVYPRLFEEAALRRLAALGRSTNVLARTLDIAFRRPSFVGDRLRVALRAFEHEGRALVVGAFFGDGERDLDRARVYAKMTLD